MRNLHKTGMTFCLIILGALILPMSAAPGPEMTGNAAPAVPDQTVTSPLRIIMPVENGKITCGFGESKHPITHQIRFHGAIDIHQKKGTPVLAAADGRVVELKSRDFDPNGNGRYIILEHEGGFQTTYTQLDSILIGKDARVLQGQKIGLLGESGLSTGPHLHFELRLNGEPVNPLDYIQK